MNGKKIKLWRHVLLTSQKRFYLSFGGSLTLQISNSRFSRRCFKFVLVYLHNFTLTICYSCYKHGVCFIVWNSIPNSYNFWLIDLRGTNCLFRLYNFVEETPEVNQLLKVILYVFMYLHMNSPKYHTSFAKRSTTADGMHTSRISISVIDKFTKNKFMRLCMRLKPKTMIRTKTFPMSPTVKLRV